MATKGKYTAEDAEKQGRFPAALVAKVIEIWCTQNWHMDYEAMVNDHDDNEGAIKRLSRFSKVSFDIIDKIHRGKKKWVEFDNADKLVTTVDPLLWHLDPDLSEAYQRFDLVWLDIQRPTCPEVNPIHLFDGLSDRTAAAVLGMAPNIVSRHRQRAAAAAAA